MRIKEYIFYLFVFSLPWQTRWIIRDLPVNGGVWEYGRVSLYGWDILVIILLLFSWSGVAGELSRWWARLRELKNQRSHPTGGHPQGEKIKIFSDPLILFCLLVLYVLCSTLWAQDRVVTLVWSLRLLEGGLVWLLVRAIKPKLFVVYWSLAAAGTLQALWAVWQLVTQTTFANKWLGVAVHPLNQGGTSVVLTTTDVWLRAYAGQVHPNVLGGLLAVTALATAWLYVAQSKEHRARSKNWVLLTAYGLQLIGLFASFSRGAWLALFISLGFWYVRRAGFFVQLDKKATIHLRWVVVISVVMFMALGALYWQPTLGRLTGGSRLEQQSVEERVGGWQDSRQLLGAAWLRGEGLGGYTKALIARDSSQPSYAYQPVHNVPLLALLELGVAGLALFLLALWHRLKPFVLNHHLLLIPLAITALFDHYWWSIPPMVLLAWLLVACPVGGD